MVELADHFIHELQHNRLSCVEEAGPLFEATPEGYYSPWRDKPRGLYGVFHGVFVFIGVHRYWRAVYDSSDISDADRNYVVDRLLRLPYQLELATTVLRRHAQLTPAGSALLGALSRDVAAIRDAPPPAGLPTDAPAWKVREDGSYERERSRVDGRLLTVVGSIREHLVLHDLEGQCRDVAIPQA